MTAGDDPTGGLDPQRLLDAIALAHARVAAALWLSAGMMCAFAAIACVALGWRRPALALGFLYFLTLCFVPNGRAQLLGPLGCGIAMAGFLWPQPRRPRR